MITDKYAVVIGVKDPTPIAYLNVFEEGDIWVKIVGCDECPEEWHLKCCGNCPMSSEKGCFYHLEERNDGSNKPFHCIINPLPNIAMSHCCLEFKCVAGTNKDKIRRVRDIRNVII